MRHDSSAKLLVYLTYIYIEIVVFSHIDHHKHANFNLCIDRFHWIQCFAFISLSIIFDGRLLQESLTIFCHFYAYSSHYNTIPYETRRKKTG